MLVKVKRDGGVAAKTYPVDLRILEEAVAPGALQKFPVGVEGSPAISGFVDPLYCIAPDVFGLIDVTFCVPDALMKGDDVRFEFDLGRFAVRLGVGDR